jgi:DNA-directed RNA polymerase specialized sigma24 family protein
VTTPREDGDPYQELRPLMFSIAYRMTGSVSDAEDIVQKSLTAMLAFLPPPSLGVGIFTYFQAWPFQESENALIAHRRCVIAANGEASRLSASWRRCGSLVRYKEEPPPVPDKRL